MANRIVHPFFDTGNGITPEDGAQWFFFIDGTNTPKNTFSDEALTTPNTNPVISDANGLFSDIWGTEGDKYKTELKDKNGVQKWAPSDPIIVPFGTITSITDQLSSKQFDTVALMVADTKLVVGDIVNTLGYLSKGDGGDNTYEIVSAATGTDDGGSFIDLTGVTGQAKGLFPRGIINATQFGAVGDGVTVDTTALLNSDIFGPTTLLPGTYRLANNLVTINVFTFVEGAKITIDTTFTLTLPDTPIASPGQNLFTGAGDVAGLQVSWVDWFGAVADGSTDDRTVIN